MQGRVQVRDAHEAAGNLSLQDGVEIGAAQTRGGHSLELRPDPTTLSPATGDGTHLTNDATDHGMFVSTDDVYAS